MTTLLHATFAALARHFRRPPEPPFDHDLLNVMAHRRAAVRMQCALSPLGGLPHPPDRGGKPIRR